MKACKPFCDYPGTNEDLVSSILFDLDEPPRWVLFVGLNELDLIDRNKWNEKRHIQFDLEKIFSRKEESALQAMAVLLHCENICPKEGNSLLDQLDDNSHKHASEVSVDLKSVFLLLILRIHFNNTDTADNVRDDCY